MRKINLQTDKSDFAGYTGVAVVQEPRIWTLGLGKIYLTVGSVFHFENGKVHNATGPAIEIKMEEGSAQIFVKHDKFDQSAPTLKVIKNNKVVETTYYNDKMQLHNLDGFAHCVQEEKVLVNKYYVNGKFVEDKDFPSHPDVLHFQKLKLKSKIESME